MNIYIFGSQQYRDDIFNELEDKNISFYLEGEVIPIEETSELLDAIKAKQDDDIFLIDDTIVKKDDKKKSLFSLFSKQKFMVEQKDIDELADSTLEANSMAEAVTQILDQVGLKQIEELDLNNEQVISTDEKITKTKDNIVKLDDIEEELESLDNLEGSLDDFSDLDELDEIALQDALKDFKIEDDIKVNTKDSVALTISSSDKSEQIENLTKAFEQLLDSNKKIKLTIEVCE